MACAGLVCAGSAFAQDKPVAAADELTQLKAQAKELEGKIKEARKTIAAAEDMVALKQKGDDAKKALAEARKTKVDADPKLVEAAKKVTDAGAKLDGMGLTRNGKPKDATKVLTDQEKTDAEAAVKALKEAQEQKAAVEKELMGTADMAKLSQAEKDAVKAYEDGLRAKVAADPATSALMKQRDELQAKIKAASAPKPQQ